LKYLTRSEHTQYIKEMFSRIADRYDLTNSLMTAGQDKRWRREIVRRAALPQDGWVLDLGTGTGSLAKETLDQHPTCHVVAADFTLDMMRTGKRHLRGTTSTSQRVGWCAADAHYLPFPDQIFDAVVSGFLLRNVSDIRQSLAAQFRVLKSGGRIVALDTTPPKRSFFAPFTLFYLRTVVPTMGKFIAGRPEDYKYLSVSTENFLHPEQLSVRLIEAGFQEVDFRHLMFGTIAIHWGRKPPGEAKR